MPEKTCKLYWFTWAYVNPSPPGEPVLSPICTLHPESNKIFRNLSAEDIVVTRREGGTEHSVQICPIADFNAEAHQAQDLLNR